MKAPVSLSRRGFIRASLAAGGVVFSHLSAGEAASPAVPPQPVLLDGWIRIAADGSVGVFSRATELGQGALTSLALVVAEELELEPAHVTVEMAPVSEAFMERAPGGPGYYVTWSSYSSRDMDSRMRKTAATVRVLLLQAAAQKWSVPQSECTTEHGIVRHRGGQSSSFGALAPLAAGLPVPQDVEPKPRSAWQRLGRSTARSDIPAKIDGSAVYGLDVVRPDMLVATISQCPIFGGKLQSVDTSTVEKMSGVKKVVVLPEAVAVVATGYWSAKQALERLHPVWSSAQKAADTAAQSAVLRQAVRSPGHLFVPEGTERSELLAAHEAAMAAGAAHLEAVYEVPFLAHAPMEPMNATAHVTPHGAELWVPTQYQSMIRTVVAEILGLRPESVIVHTTAVGGGFGRRCEIDYAIQAAQIARHFSNPVKLIWSREEDISRGYFRPMAAIELKAALDAQGRPTAFSFASACPSIMDYSIERRNGIPQDLVEHFGLANAREWPYAVGAQKIALASTDLGVPVTWMRSVGAVASDFGLECFVDEMAAAAGVDPIEYRLRLLAHRPRELAVLRKAAEIAGWDKPLQPGRHRGFALYTGNGSVVAQVVELDIDPQRVVRLRRVHCVVDCGIALNPDVVVAQMEGGIIFGLSGALLGEISIKDGASQQKNFDSYPLQTLAQTPRIEVSILQSDAPVGGVGEEAVPPVAAAVANALFSATGQRMRSLPLMRNGLSLGAAAESV